MPMITDLLQKTEEALQASYRFLEVANRYTEMEPLLKEFVSQVKDLSGCEAVGMRILDEEGNIPGTLWGRCLFC